MDATDLEAQSDVAFSRSAGLLSQSGNADSELKCRVSDEDADAFRMLARSHGMTTSELLRILVKVKLHGVDGVARMTAEQLALVAGNGQKRVRP